VAGGPLPTPDNMSPSPYVTPWEESVKAADEAVCDSCAEWETLEDVHEKVAAAERAVADMQNTASGHHVSAAPPGLEEELQEHAVRLVEGPFPEVLGVRDVSQNEPCNAQSIKGSMPEDCELRRLAPVLEEPDQAPPLGCSMAAEKEEEPKMQATTLDNPAGDVGKEPRLSGSTTMSEEPEKASAPNGDQSQKSGDVPVLTECITEQDALQKQVATPPREVGEARLPLAIAKFQTLKEDPGIEILLAPAAGLQDLECAVERAPTDETAADNLRTLLEDVSSRYKSALAGRLSQPGLMKECASVSRLGNKLSREVHGAAWDLIRESEEQAIKTYLLYAAAVCARIMPTTPCQRAADVVTLYQDGANARQLNNLFLQDLAQRCGDRFEGPELRLPGLKCSSRIIEKAILRKDAPGDASTVFDIVRSMLVVQRMEHATQVLEVFMEFEAEGRIVIVRLKDRFTTESASGWRDAIINFYFADDCHRHICECQIVHKTMLSERRDIPSQVIYGRVRNASELMLMKAGASAACLSALLAVADEVDDDGRLEAMGWFGDGPVSTWQGLALDAQTTTPIAHVEIEKIFGLADRESLTALPDAVSKFAGQLRTLDLGGCAGLITLPASIWQLTGLLTLSLRNCKELTALPESVGQFAQLNTLDLLQCASLTMLPDSVGSLAKLQTLNLGFCGKLASLPESIGELAELRTLSLGECGSLAAVPESLGRLGRLQSLDMQNCRRLASLPSGIGGLAGLETLSLSGCETLSELPASVGNLANLQTLNLGECASLAALPDSIGDLVGLQRLEMCNCTALSSLPSTIGNLAGLQSLSLRGAHRLTHVPESVGRLTRLHELDLGECGSLKTLPESVGGLVKLQTLHLRDCRELLAVPDSIGNLAQLQRLSIAGCSTLATLSECITQITGLQVLR